MRTLSSVLLLLATAVVAAPTHGATLRDLSLTLPDGRAIAYGLSLPDGGETTPRPLVLALHPGGERMPRYGSWFARNIVMQAIAPLNAIVVAPDCPAQRWSDADADAMVMQLLQKVMAEHNVDRRRVLVVGFSMGGGGAWSFSSQHPDLFTGAIPMAAMVGSEPVEKLATMPTYVIHSRADSVVPFGPAETNARKLEQLGRPIRFEALDDLPHFSMGGYVPSLQRAVQWVTERWKQ
ncbi:MAG: PHB depolymerase family esterase [Vicinamibacterales bacterium]